MQDRSPHRDALQARPVELDAGEGDAVEVEAAQFGDGEVDPGEGAALEDGARQVGLAEQHVGERGVGEPDLVEPGHAEVGAHQAGPVERGTRQLGRGQHGVGQIGVVEVRLRDVAALELAAGEIGIGEVGAAQRARPEFTFPRGDPREITSRQVARVEPRHHLSLENPGKAGHLLHRLLDVADAVDGQLERRRLVFALGAQLSEPFLQVGQQVGLQLADAPGALVGGEDVVDVVVQFVTHDWLSFHSNVSSTRLAYSHVVLLWS